MDGRTKKEKGSSATDYVTDVTDVTDVKDRRKKEEGRRKKEEGKRKKEEGKRKNHSSNSQWPITNVQCFSVQLPITNSQFPKQIGRAPHALSISNYPTIIS
jgi:hypothetical protein